MALDQSEFEKLADSVIEYFGELIDDVAGDVVEVDIHNGILTLTLSKGPKGGQYVINKHGPNREIWLSSPVSGAAHFTLRDGQWVSTRDASVVLHAVLSKELSDFTGLAVKL